MKKIVALVLCLALALSLCTVAFAATFTAIDGQTVPASSNWKIEKHYAAAADDNYAVRYNILTKGSGNWNVWAADYALTDANGADYKLVDGNTVTYLRADYEYTRTATVVNTVKHADADKCGEAFVIGNTKIYEGSDGEYYYSVKNGTTELLVDDKIIEALPATTTYVELDEIERLGTTANATTMYVIAHTLDVETEENDAGVLGVKSVECKECKAKLAFETDYDDAVVTFGAGNFVNFGAGNDAIAKTYITDIDLDGWTGALYVKSVIGTTAGSADKTETVESAKTFDAGIALYAGMALASVAGSAVVIGKKKEF